MRSVRLEVLHVTACPNLAPLLDRLSQATDLPVTTRIVDTDADAARFGMAGSPTLLIDGVDPFKAPPPPSQTGPLGQVGECVCSVSCRLYRDETGRIVPAPSIEQLRAAIAASQSHENHENHGERDDRVEGQGMPPDTPAGVLSAWRTRALPLDPVEKAAHRAVLWSFATTGRAPSDAELDAAIATVASERSGPEVLQALHDIDAIRLTSDGRIAVAYPFSATPTRHRVRIFPDPASGSADPAATGARAADGLDVYAMCAIDALGIAPMLDQDTLIESIDITTGQPVTVTTTISTSAAGGQILWEPASAVVFVGSDEPSGGRDACDPRPGLAGRPSSDCCCDYLNFFTDQGTAEAWTEAHRHVPGQILDQAAAETLAARLFGHLLAGQEGCS